MITKFVLVLMVLLQDGTMITKSEVSGHCSYTDDQLQHMVDTAVGVLGGVEGNVVCLKATWDALGDPT